MRRATQQGDDDDEPDVADVDSLALSQLADRAARLAAVVAAEHVAAAHATGAVAGGDDAGAKPAAMARSAAAAAAAEKENEKARAEQAAEHVAAAHATGAVAGGDDAGATPAAMARTAAAAAAAEKEKEKARAEKKKQKQAAVRAGKRAASAATKAAAAAAAKAAAAPDIAGGDDGGDGSGDSDSELRAAAAAADEEASSQLAHALDEEASSQLAHALSSVDNSRHQPESRRPAASAGRARDSDDESDSGDERLERLGASVGGVRVDAAQHGAAPQPAYESMDGGLRRSTKPMNYLGHALDQKNAKSTGCRQAIMAFENWWFPTELTFRSTCSDFAKYKNILEVIDGWFVRDPRFGRVPRACPLDLIKELGHVNRNLVFELLVLEWVDRPYGTVKPMYVHKYLENLMKYMKAWEGTSDELRLKYGDWSIHSSPSYYGVKDMIKELTKLYAATGGDLTSDANVEGAISDTGGNAHPLYPEQVASIMQYYRFHKSFLEKNHFQQRHPDTLKHGLCGFLLGKTQNSGYTVPKKQTPYCDWLECNRALLLIAVCFCGGQRARGDVHNFSTHDFKKSKITPGFERAKVCNLSS